MNIFCLFWFLIKEILTHVSEYQNRKASLVLSWIWNVLQEFEGFVAIDQRCGDTVFPKIIGGCVSGYVLWLSSIIYIYRLWVSFVEAKLPRKHHLSASKCPVCVIDSTPARCVLTEMTFGWVQLLCKVLENMKHLLTKIKDRWWTSTLYKSANCAGNAQVGRMWLCKWRVHL